MRLETRNSSSPINTDRIEFNDRSIFQFNTISMYNEFLGEPNEINMQ